LASGSEKKTRTRRHYRPTVEGLEALRLLSGATHAHPLSALAAEHDLLAEPVRHASPLGDDAPSVSSATWDAALVQTQLAEILSPPGTSAASSTTAAPFSSRTPRATTTGSDAKALVSGLSQLNKYLNRAWYRAGIPAQHHDDNSQGVYTALLQNLGRQRFDTLVADVGHSGVKEVFSRETSEGLAFFRAVDMVKKRAQRERAHQSLESVDVPSASRNRGTGAAWRDALQEAIEHNLSPREAALIQDTLMGKTPAEIADQWGVAPKTVSNEKSRVLQKLRDALANHEMN
jgi:DNA-binding CsgD family transcriptional regulator